MLSGLFIDPEFTPWWLDGDLSPAELWVLLKATMAALVGVDSVAGTGVQLSTLINLALAVQTGESDARDMDRATAAVIRRLTGG